MIALFAGTLLAVAALAFVLYPLFFETRRPTAMRPPKRREADDSAIRALREIEFDRATGKLSDADYNALRARYGARAVREMRDAGAATALPADDIEARVRELRATHRECPTCGLRPEPDAIYCSTCGGFIDKRCPTCNAEIVESSAGYCSSCGATLGATAGR